MIFKVKFISIDNIPKKHHPFLNNILCVFSSGIEIISSEVVFQYILKIIAVPLVGCVVSDFS